MIRKIFALCFLSFATGFAAEPSSSAPKPCVLLKNQNVIWGRATQEHEQVVVRRDDGTEVRLQRKQVACWAEKIDDLHQFRLDHRQIGNIRIHLDDARWCLQYGLLDAAAKELTLAYKYEPTNIVAITLEQQLLEKRKQLHQSTLPNALPIENPEPMPKSSGGEIQLASHEAEIKTESDTSAAVQLDEHSIHAFARFMQPILLNRCANCHAGDTKQKFKLLAAPTGTRPSTRITKRNAELVMQYVNLASPLKSELFAKATDGHGGRHGTLTGEDRGTARTMHNWLTSIRKKTAGPIKQMSAERNLASESPVQPIPSVVDDLRAAPTLDDSSAIKRLPTVANPFDPELFNRRYHKDGGVQQAILQTSDSPAP